MLLRQVFYFFAQRRKGLKFLSINSQTVFVMAKFPRALPNEYFHHIGRAIAANNFCV
ncbi:hypothetical protein H6G74_22150 [Nostoc spongiaeforme FACHB-130]|uniref:Transposase n=1 Tax=Nostoc spongiaeforme FACHB-130 TaxID=1357510 RepID=A0ABR8G1D6_9NOSO|nr:hypothetical protein [Nostoc spongiaeforme]MBD2597007.1 hypothetical protein [Nostoc spongiaeforme FACHB-130]